MNALPGALPPWISIRHVVTAAHAFGLLSCLVPYFLLATVSTGIPLYVENGDFFSNAGLIFGAPPTILVALVTSLLAGRAKSDANAAVFSTFGGSFTFMVGGLACGFHRLANGGMGEFFNDRYIAGRMIGAHSLIGVVACVCAGAMTGAIAGLVLARPVMWAAKNARAGRDDASGRALLGVGAWMLLPAFIALGSVLIGGRTDPMPGFIALLISWTVAIAVAGVGALLLRRRGRWLEAVRQGQVPRYRLRAGDAADARLPGLDEELRRDDDVLEEVVESDPNPYRGAQIATPIARVNRR